MFYEVLKPGVIVSYNEQYVPHAIHHPLQRSIATFPSQIVSSDDANKEYNRAAGSVLLSTSNENTIIIGSGKMNNMIGTTIYAQPSVMNIVTDFVSFPDLIKPNSGRPFLEQDHWYKLLYNSKTDQLLAVTDVMTLNEAQQEFMNSATTSVVWTFTLNLHGTVCENNFTAVDVKILIKFSGWQAGQTTRLTVQMKLLTTPNTGTMSGEVSLLKGTLAANGGWSNLIDFETLYNKYLPVEKTFVDVVQSKVYDDLRLVVLNKAINYIDNSASNVADMLHNKISI